MKTIMIYALLALLGLNCQSCGGQIKKGKNMRTIFSWSPSVSAPDKFPVEFKYCNVGFGDKGQSFPVLDTYPVSGIATSGAGGIDLNMFDVEQGFPIPNSLDILWVSYAERKFYKADIKFSQEMQDRMLELFREGYYNVENDQYYRYNNFVVTLLPEGKIWFYLDGPGRWTRIDFVVQAEEIQMELSDFTETRHKTMDEFCKGRLSDYPDAVEYLSKNAIPKGLWETYAERFPYDIKIEFEDEQAVLDPDYGYYFSNGEMFGSMDSVNINAYARLTRLIMAWNVENVKYTGFFYFNEDDVINNFREAFGKNHSPNIRGEFVIRVSKYNNWFDIILRVGDKEFRFDNEKRTQIHVFRQGVDQHDRDAIVFYNNHRGIQSRDIKFIGE